MKKFLAAMLSLITTALCFPQTRLHAAHATPLFHATREFRDATQYLSRMVTYHASLAPAQKLFLNRLIHSSHQLYALALASPLHAVAPLETEFRQTWADIQSLVKDLPWMIETLPTEAKQTLAPHCRQFLATFQTLAVQIELSEPVCVPCPLGGNAALMRATAPSQMLMNNAELMQFPEPRQYDRSIGRRAGQEISGVISLSRQTLSPSQWQSHHAGLRPRSEAPIRSENSKAGAQLTRLTLSK